MSAVVGFDTATPLTAVAALERGGRVAFECALGPGPEGRPRHGPALIGAVSDAVDAAGGWGSVELIAVGVGPGSFTGLRIGVTTARSLAQARERPLVGVPTTAALAAGIEVDPGRDRLAVIDARRGEVFAGLLPAGEERALAPVVCSPAELADAIEGARGAVAAGDGALRFRSELEAAGIEVLDPEDPGHSLSARHICILGSSMTIGSVEDVRPLYLRRPDAERWIERDGRD